MLEWRIDTTERSEMIDITRQVASTLAQKGFSQGLLILYVPHTTAGITINEGADPTVVQDILSYLEERVPWEGNYRHLEGNSAAHIKATLVGSSVQVFVEGGQLELGTWQSIFFCEFDGPRRGRKVWGHWIPC